MTTTEEFGLDGANDIYGIVIECTTLFESLAEQARLGRAKEDASDEESEGENGKMNRSTEDMRSFNLWIDYTGALAAESSRSLDARLRGHRDIREMVIELLQMLVRNLEYLPKGDEFKPDIPSDSGGNEGDGDQDELEEEARGAILKALDELHIMAAAIRRSSVRSQKYNLSTHFRRDDDSCS